MNKVLALNNLWHPNIKLLADERKVCVSYLREMIKDGYTSARTLYDIIESLRFILFNNDAAQQYNKNPELFEFK